MRRFLVFGGDHYYPIGGWDDFKGDYDTKEAACVAAPKYFTDWWHVVDQESGEQVADGHQKA